MRLTRPRLGTIPLILIVSAYLFLLTNETFWRKGIGYFAGHELQLVGLGVGLFLLCVALLSVLSAPYVVKPVLILAIVVSAAASYFVDAFGLVIDRDMIANVALTTTTEAGHLLTPSLLIHLAGFGLVPALLVAATRITPRSVGVALRQIGAVAGASLVATLAIVFAFYPGFASTFRSHGDLMATFNPGGPIVAAVQYAARRTQERNIVAAPLGTDATIGPRAVASTRPVVTVLVIGETARAMNFGLNGYDRDTTPELARRDVVSFSSVSSCGTATAVSMPCMFSNLTRAAYSSRRARATENLTDVLHRAGLDVRWFDNDTGSIHVADRMGDRYVFLPPSADPRFCQDGECRDDILVERLRVALAGVTRDTVFILHQLGSHGPAYYQRYTKDFQRFTPDCRSGEFTQCTRAEVVNAYDNTIVYTDHVLAKTIDLLQSRADLATTMLYVSDHGESLGENGLYLHGVPYMIAPATQTQVPMIAWFSEPYRVTTGLDGGCVAASRDTKLSHDNLFHSVLGLAGVVTRVYDAKLDAFAGCRGTAGPAVR